MGRLGLLAACAGLVLATVGASAVAGSTPARRPCPTHKTFSHNLVVIVARLPGVVIETVMNHPYSAGGITSVYACYPPTRRRTLLDDQPLVHGDGLSPHDGYLPHTLTLSGSFAAFVWEGGEGPDLAYTGIDLVDARTGRQANIAVPHVGYSFLQPVVRLVLKPTGRLAWSQRHGVFICRRDCLAPVGLGRHFRRVARGAGIDARSLHATPRGIAWRQNGRWEHRPLA